MLGGSSGINGQAFIAASQATIDAWSQLGNNGWNWENLLPYSKKAYTINLPDNATKEHLGLEWIDGAVHGTSGPIQVSFPATIQNPLAKAWVNAFKSLGYNATVDPYSGYSVGGYNSLAAVDPTTKTRSYAASGYRILAMKKPGVHIITEAVVQQVLLEESSPNLRAIGVKAVINGQTHIIKARKEVIISSGAFNTPKLLELSGIGNQNILEELGIQVMIHNPNVGENLQDHLMSGISFEAVDGVITGDPILRQEPEAVQAAMKSYAEHREGPMTIGGVQSSAFMPFLEFDDPDGRTHRKLCSIPIFAQLSNTIRWFVSSWIVRRRQAVQFSCFLLRQTFMSQVRALWVLIFYLGIILAWELSRVCHSLVEKFIFHQRIRKNLRLLTPSISHIRWIWRLWPGI